MSIVFIYINAYIHACMCAANKFIKIEQMKKVLKAAEIGIYKYNNINKMIEN